MESKNTVKEETTVAKNWYVITKDGIRMSYEEYMDMVRSERD